jgi:hypothetical protein
MRNNNTIDRKGFLLVDEAVTPHQTNAKQQHHRPEGIPFG